MNDIVFNEGQEAAISKAVTWFKKTQDRRERVKKYFFLAGYAGTGKTSVARAIADLCAPPSRVVYIAPTGKAASRLRAKGCYGAKTLHKFLYNFVGDLAGKPEFVMKGSLEETPLLIVLDEASMVGKRDFNNLLSLNIPILALGDLGQLEPVDDESYFVPENCDFNLEKIERNGGNITRASFYVRTGGRLPCREYDDVKVRDGMVPGVEIKKHTAEDSVILCSYNSTRQHMNFKARAMLGLSGMKLPQPGEKLVCTFNQHTYNIMNGEQVIFHKFSEIPPADLQPGEDPEFIKMIHFTSLTNEVDGVAKCNLGCFLCYDEADKAAQMEMSGGWDFGYALTIHKSQGSEWDNVLIIEEFLKGASYEKLMYTGITRAIKHVTLYRAN